MSNIKFMFQKNFFKIWILIIAIIVVVITILVWQKLQVPTKEIVEPKIKEQEQSLSDETVDWKIYRNEKYGFEVKYPRNWQEPIGRKSIEDTLFVVDFYKYANQSIGFRVFITNNSSVQDNDFQIAPALQPNIDINEVKKCDQQNIIKDITIGAENYPAKEVYVPPRDKCFQETYYFVILDQTLKLKYIYSVYPILNGCVGCGKAKISLLMPEFYQILSTFRFLK